jgi:hypothetical protein
MPKLRVGLALADVAAESCALKCHTLWPQQISKMIWAGDAMRMPKLRVGLALAIGVSLLHAVSR